MHRRSFLLGLAASAVSLPATATLAPASKPSPLVSLHVGTLLNFVGDPPPGWLLCDGRAVSRTYYAELFELLGTSHGAGDGVTTFNLPNYWVNVKEPDVPLKIEEVPVQSHGFGEMQHHTLSITLVHLAIYTGVE